MTDETLNIWVPFYDDLDQLKQMVATVPSDSHVYAVDGRHASFPGSSDLTDGAKDWCDEKPTVTYCAPSEGRLPWGHSYDDPNLRGPQYEKARFANYEVLPGDEWVLKLDTDERVVAFDTGVLDRLDPMLKYSPPIDVLMWRGYHPTRLYVPEHWTFWLADQFYPRDFYPRDTPVEQLIHAAAETNHSAVNLGGFVDGAYIENVGEERDSGYQDRRAEQLETIGRVSRAQQYETGQTVEVAEFSGVNEQVRWLDAVDWDVLIVLDAMRWDYWRDHSGDGTPITSPAVCTHHWLQHIGRYIDFRETTGIIANPVALTHAPPTLQHRVSCMGYARNINGISAIDPYDVTERVLRELEMGADRVYAHYPTPHGPYPQVDPPIPVFTPDTDIDVEEDELLDQNMFADYIDNDDHWLTHEHLIAGYEANVEWSINAIQPIVSQCDGTVVVTADHGELLGDRVDGERYYGHKPGFGQPEELTTVPWVEYD